MDRDSPNAARARAAHAEESKSVRRPAERHIGMFLCHVLHSFITFMLCILIFTPRLHERPINLFFTQDDPLHEEIMSLINKVEVAASSRQDPVYKLIKGTFARRHTARQNNDPRLATLDGYLEQYPFMDNSRCIDYEGICALREWTEGGNGWLKKEELHMNWLRIGAAIFALLAQEGIDVPKGWFSLFHDAGVTPQVCMYW